MTTTIPTIENLFDLVAPIAITGGADMIFMSRAEKAWKQIKKIGPDHFVANKCPAPDLVLKIKNREHFDRIYHDFALDAYNTLFRSIVEATAPNLVYGADYWGARGYKHAGVDNKTHSPLVGSQSGFLPWFETAGLLKAAVKKYAGN